jgi:hypothetical protein
MFLNQRGDRRTDAERIVERIQQLPDAQIAALPERRAILQNAITSFNERVAQLPDRERNAALSLLLSEITTIIFDFHLSLETRTARQKIQQARTGKAKLEAWCEFRTLTEELLALYAVA